MFYSVVFVLILLVGFLVKIPALFHPLVGHFGSYQVINGMMASMMSWNEWSSLLIPKTFIVMHGKPALHLLYYPFASFVAFSLKSLFGGTIDFWGRCQASVFTFLSSILLYRIALRSFNQKVALMAVFLFTFSPMVLITGMSFQNEAIGVFFLLVSYLILFSGLHYGIVVFSGILFSLALIARIHFIVCLPAFLMVFWKHRTSAKNLFLFAFMLTLPLVAWLGFTYHLSRISDNVITSFFSQMGEGRILSFSSLHDAAFSMKLWKIVAGEWLTPLALPVLLFSLFSANKKQWPFLIWFLGSLGLIILIPQKVANHGFYLVCGVPAACILIAIFLDSILPVVGRGSLLVFFLLFFLLSFRYYLPPMLSPVQASFKEIPVLGSQIQKAINRNDLIIAAYGSSPELLYYSKRFGWSFDVAMNLTPTEIMPERHRQAVELGYGNPMVWLERLRKEGARYFVVGEPGVFRARVDFYHYVREHYREVLTTDRSLMIFDVGKSIRGEG